MALATDVFDKNDALIHITADLKCVGLARLASMGVGVEAVLAKGGVGVRGAVETKVVAFAFADFLVDRALMKHMAGEEAMEPFGERGR